jgi:uncharacterized membrane protein (DUF485 family)
MFNVSKILSTAFKVGFITLVIAFMLAVLGAPVFLGAVILTASVLMTVWVYGVLGFIIGAVYKWLSLRKAQDATP